MDWSKIKTEYITTDTSYRKLAAKYHVSQTQICNRSKAEGWIAAREQYLSRIVTKAVDKSAERESNKLVKLMSATVKIVDIALAALDDGEQFNRYIISEGLGGGATETSEMIFAKKDTKAMRDVMVILKEATTLMRDFYNIPTPAQSEAQRIAAARLELEQRKSERESEDKPVTLEIVGLPEAYKA